MTLAEVEAVFRKWLHLPDLGALYAMLGTIAANRLPGDPIWLLLVGPPGGGKTELLNTISTLPDSYPAATITEAALLSGVPRKEHGEGAKGGLLREIGEFGIIVAKDFGSVLSMNRDARSILLAALREIYDGAWTRHVGADGGRQLHWAGKVGFVGGVTPTIDRHHAVMGAMGERFILYRLPEPGPEQQAMHALAHAGHEKQMRAELAAAAGSLVSTARPSEAPFSEEDADRLIDITLLIVRARSAVERDSYTRDIELIPQPEAPTRLVIVLRRLLEGLDAIGLDRDVAWQVVAKAALDSIPAIRLACLFTLQSANGDVLDTNRIAQLISYPASTTRRALEDLTAHGLTNCTPDPGKAHRWGLQPFAEARLGRLPVLYTHTCIGIEKRDSEQFGKAFRDQSPNGNQPLSEQAELDTADDDIFLG